MIVQRYSRYVYCARLLAAKPRAGRLGILCTANRLRSFHDFPSCSEYLSPAHIISRAPCSRSLSLRSTYSLMMPAALITRLAIAFYLDLYPRYCLLFHHSSPASARHVNQTACPSRLREYVPCICARIHALASRSPCPSPILIRILLICFTIITSLNLHGKSCLCRKGIPDMPFQGSKMQNCRVRRNQRDSPQTITCVVPALSLSLSRCNRATPRASPFLSPLPLLRAISLPDSERHRVVTCDRFVNLALGYCVNRRQERYSIRIMISR